MPTPVSVARQCLTPDASRALDEAVAVARRRNHAQTTSLHALSAILSLPSSLLRDACSRVRSNTYSCRLQFRALELCFSSALDRLPSSQPQDEPPISNSFMAAIKRSQANQRRHPEAFHFNVHYSLQQHQQQQHQQSSSSSTSTSPSSSSSLSCVKVELQQLILSILDDPVVSRVFAEAGFRSCDLKLAILRPPPPLVSRYPRSRPPPLFLCNLPGSDSDHNMRNFSFPFLGKGVSDTDDTCRRISEILSRKKERNPLLVGVSAVEAVRNFGEMVQTGKAAGLLLPLDISALNFVSIANEICQQQRERDGSLSSKFRDLENYSGPGLVVTFGDLKLFIDDDADADAHGSGSGSGGVITYAVAQLTRLLEFHRGKLWLLGAVESYDMYFKFLIKFPSIDKDWDLRLLPITCLTNSMEPPLQSRPHSLTESFIPFGGFFAMPSDLKSPLSSAYLPTSRCDLCDEKYEQEVSAVVNGGCTSSVADQYQESLPSWLQMAEINGNKGLDLAKAKDDGTILNAKITGLQRKWNDICHLNHSSKMSEADLFRDRSPQTFSGTMGFPFVADMRENSDNYSICSRINAFPKESEYSNLLPFTSMGSQKISQPNHNMSPVVSESKNKNMVSEVKSSKSEWIVTKGLQVSPCPPDSNIIKGHALPSCPASVTTDLGLGTLYATYKEPKKPTFQAHKERLQDFTDCLPSKINLVNPNISDHSVQSSAFSGSDLSSQSDPKDFKSLWRSLSGRVGWQSEAIHAISQTIARCRAGNERRRGASLKRDIWFSFVGPDRVAKKRIAMALAEILYDNKENLICVDLNSQEEFTRTNTIFGCQEIFGYDDKFRGKTVVDYIGEEISKKPLSVVFLENINKADLLLQTFLSQAIKTGKFSYSHGKETSTNNAIFVATADTMKDHQNSSFEKTRINFSEDTIIGAQSLEMEILIGSIPEDNIIFSNSNVLVTSRNGTCGPTSVNKRKLVASCDIEKPDETSEWTKRAHRTTRYLDLNIPIEVEVNDSDCGSSDSNSVSQNSESWLEDFFNEMDDTVIFKPFDFAALADRVVFEISVIFRKTVGFEAVLEIDSKVMEQILAAAWLSDEKRAIEDWVEQVLGKSFTEARQRYAFTNRPVLKLANREGFYLKEQAAAICLPTRIILS